RRVVLAGVLILLSVAMGLVSGAVTAPLVTVPGSSDPYLAGMPDGSTCCGGDSAPAQSPVLVGSVTAGSVLTFSVTGSVNFVPNPPTDPPDGSGLVSTPANDGIAAITAPADSLVGVFLGPSRPDSTAAPAGLDFSPGGLTTSFTALSPALKQVFFIGDGLTGNGTGAAQRFTVPAGATRLLLGTEDGFGWFNNSASFNATVIQVSAVSVPTLGPAALAGMGLLLAGLAALILTRR